MFLLLYYISYTCWMSVLPGNLLPVSGKGEEAITKGEIGIKRGNTEFNFR